MQSFEQTSVVKTIKEQGIILERLSFQFANWNRGQAENKMTQLINQYGDEIELVLSNNDEMALGAVAAYDALDYDKDRRPMIFGIDWFGRCIGCCQKRHQFRGLCIMTGMDKLSRFRVLR